MLLTSPRSLDWSLDLFDEVGPFPGFLEVDAWVGVAVVVAACPWLGVTAVEVFFALTVELSLLLGVVLELDERELELEPELVAIG